MGELQDLIATSSIRAYHQGARDERERILGVIDKEIQRLEETDKDSTLEGTEILIQLKKTQLHVKELKWT
jgi:hypothetical protein